MALTKSEYSLGKSCHKKVEWKRQGIESLSDKDLLQIELGNAGKIIHHLASMLFPDALLTVPLRRLLRMRPVIGREIELNTSEFIARADVIKIDEKTITLIEIKSEAHPVDDNGELVPVFNDRGLVRSEFREVIDDVSFQALNLMELVERMSDEYDGVLPELRYELMLVNPAFMSGETTLRHHFEVSGTSVRHKHVVDIAEIEAIFIRLDVTDAVQRTCQEMNLLRNQLNQKIVSQQAPYLSSACKRCEFRMNLFDDDPSGFVLCWGADGYQFPHVLDVPYVGKLKINGEDAVHVLEQQGACRATDIPRDILQSTYNNMQARVLEAYERNEELIDVELSRILAAHPAPHVFIDVEAFNGGLSLWKGGRPYEIAAFQLSCHMIDANGALHHTYWLHEDSVHPAAMFLSKLYEAVKDAGTMYIWSQYERSAVKHAIEAVDRMGMPLDEEVRRWAMRFLDKENPDVVDLLDLSRRYYVHPGTRGSSSIKDVLNAIWKKHHRDYLPMFVKYHVIDDGDLIKPYETLPKNFGSNVLATIRNGGDAVIGYYEMLFGRGRNRLDVRDAIREALLAYCELDTAAMVIIWRRFSRV